MNLSLVRKRANLNKDSILKIIDISTKKTSENQTQLTCIPPFLNHPKRKNSGNNDAIPMLSIMNRFIKLK